MVQIVNNMNNVKSQQSSHDISMNVECVHASPRLSGICSTCVQRRRPRYPINPACVGVDTVCACATGGV